MANKTSEAQKKASRKWEKENPEKTKLAWYRRNARRYIKTMTSLLDIEELKNDIAEREKQLTK